MDVAYKNNAGAVVEEHIVGVSIVNLNVEPDLFVRWILYPVQDDKVVGRHAGLDPVAG